MNGITNHQPLTNTFHTHHSELPGTMHNTASHCTTPPHSKQHYSSSTTSPHTALLHITQPHSEQPTSPNPTHNNPAQYHITAHWSLPTKHRETKHHHGSLRTTTRHSSPSWTTASSCSSQHYTAPTGLRRTNPRHLAL